jgi:hypothetical protein
MKTYLFVTEDGEAVQRLVREASERGVDVQLMVSDEARSVELRQMYDVTTRPAALVTMDDGSYVRLWQGSLPSVDKLYYAVQGR